MIDYVLTAAVGISAGVGALVSAAPSLEPRTLELCLGILLIITIVNLRGVRETGAIFMLPTYLFVGTLLIIVGVGIFRMIVSGGHPVPVSPPSPMPIATVTLGAWLLLKAFASGCTAMTGVEAVSNGVQAFRKPVTQSAQKTLSVIIALLIILLLGIAFLSHAYGIGATPPGHGYQSVLSQLTAAVAGRGWFYMLTIASILLVLSLSANTAFADFPRLCRLVAEDYYLPTPLATRGRRLVFAMGVIVLAILSRDVANHFRWSHRSAYSPLCRRRFSCVHSFTSRHGASTGDTIAERVGDSPSPSMRSAQSLRLALYASSALQNFPMAHGSPYS